jgi:hypothetical protein
MSSVLGERAALLGEVMASKDRRFVDLTQYATRNGALTPEASKKYESDVAAAWAHADKVGGAPVIYDGAGLSIVKKGGGSVTPRASTTPEQPTTKYDQMVAQESAAKESAKVKKLKAEIDELTLRSDNVGEISPVNDLFATRGSLPRVRKRTAQSMQEESRRLKVEATKKQKELDDILKKYPDALK